MLTNLDFRKYGLAGILINAAVLSVVFLSSRAGAAQGTVSIDSVAAGVGLDVDVALSAVDVGPPGLGAWTLDVAYDPSIVVVTACQAEQGGICNESFGLSTVRVAGISLNCLAGTSELANISFRCVAVGTSVLTPSIDVLSDASLGAPQPIAAITQNGAIVCTTYPPMVPEEPAPPPGSDPDKLAGDADCDGEVDAIDAAHVLQFEAGLLAELDCANNADANHDGIAGPIDAAIILQTSAGLLG